MAYVLSPKDHAMRRRYLIPVALGGVLLAALIGSQLVLVDRWTLNPRLVAAVSSGNDEAARALLARGADPNCQDNGFTALYYATQPRRASTVELLLTAGADPNGRNTDDGGTALMNAASLGEVDIAALLLRHGADPSVKDRRGYTASRWAKEGGYLHLMRLLEHEATRRK